MFKRLVLLLSPIICWGAACPEVSGISASTRNGQTFITWTDPATAGAGAAYRYNLYRSTSAITSVAGLTPEQTGLPNNSGLRMWGYFSQYNQTVRQNPTLTANSITQAPMSTIVQGGSPIPLWSGLAVVTIPSGRTSYYAVTTTAIDSSCTESGVTAGVSATTTGTVETVASIQAVRQVPNTDGVQNPSIYGFGADAPPTGWPLVLWMHASGGQANQPNHGDLWQYWGDKSMGWQDGIHDIFTVFQGSATLGSTYSGPQTGANFQKGTLVLAAQDATEGKDFLDTVGGSNGFQTSYFGYKADAVTGYPGTTGAVTAAFPYTENRLTWMTQWAINHYGADPNRVYASGHSLGGWGSGTYPSHHPEIFAAVFADLPWWKTDESKGGRALPWISTKNYGSGLTPVAIFMPNGTQRWVDYYDQAARVNCDTYQVPILWGIGRHDAFAGADANPDAWYTHKAMAQALQACHLWVAFNWSNGTHASDDSIALLKNQYLTPFSFRKNVSYPVPTHFSLDDDPGLSTDTTSGCINCGWTWKSSDQITPWVPTESGTQWAAWIANSRGTGVADISIRNAQSFTPIVGTTVHWATSAGQSGDVTVDSHGVITAPSVTVPSTGTVITFSITTAQTWYIRTDGGTAAQCDGKHDAAYPGSGTGQACGFANPFWLWTNDPDHSGAAETPVWKIAAGDTVIIKNGQYRMGYKANTSVLDPAGWWNYTGCRGNTRNCMNPPFPTDGVHYTRILGEGWNTGCTVKPQLWGGTQVDGVFNLESSSYVDIECLEVTDHEQCRLATSENPSVTDPYACIVPSALLGITIGSDFMYYGFKTNTSTNHIVFRNLNIHGIASAGFQGPVGGNISWDNITMQAVGNIGFSFTTSIPSYGPLTFTNIQIRWTACAEEYPITHAFPILWCGDQAGANASGDAYGFIDVYGDVTIDRNVVEWNQQDGLDALYIVHGGNLNVTNSIWRGNEGNQIKTGGATNMNIFNNIIISDCYRQMYDFPGMPNPGLWNKWVDGVGRSLAGPCRSGEDVALINKWDSTMKFINNTVIGVNSTIYDASCHSVVETITSAGRTDYRGNLDTSVKLDGTSRFYPTSDAISVAGESAGVAITGRTQVRTGLIYTPSNAAAANRYPITSIDTTGNRIIRSGNGQPANGTRLRIWSSTGSYPSPLVEDTYYYVLNSNSTGFQLEASVGGGAIDLTTVGGGTLYFDKDCSGGNKCDWYYQQDVAGVTADPATYIPTTSDTMTFMFYGTHVCDGSKFIFQNNLTRAYKPAPYYNHPTPNQPNPFYSTAFTGSTGIDPLLPQGPDTRRNNFFCGVKFQDTTNNRPSSTETWQLTTCPGTWFSTEYPGGVLSTNLELDNIDVTLPSGSPAIDAGLSRAEVTTDYIGTSRPQGSGYDIGAYERVISIGPITLSVSPSSQSVQPGVPATFTVSGGTLPYFAAADGCSVSVVGVAVTATCSAPGSHGLTVTDSASGSGTATIVVLNPVANVRTQCLGCDVQGVKIK